ncbi:MAG: hypothetical protein MI799_16820 [Desulfobacterales bacterium]|nr:hypothetical protein [Desulfobacterales bacterium]
MPPNRLLDSKFHISDINTLPSPPPTRFHHNRRLISDIDLAADRVKRSLGPMAELYQIAVSQTESQWIREWPPNGPDGKKARPYTTFIQEEQRLKEADVRMLKAHPLEERRLRLRPLGYLKFDHTRLGSSGRVINIFRSTDQTLFSENRYFHLNSQNALRFSAYEGTLNPSFPDLNPYITLSTNGRRKIWALKKRTKYSKKESG